MRSGIGGYTLGDITFCDLRELPLGTRVAACHRFYRNVYLPNFPQPDLREGPEIWLPLMTFDPPPPRPLLHIILAFDGGRRRDVLGGFVCEYYRGSGVGLGTYLVVDAANRRKGIGRELVARGRAALAADAKVEERKRPTLFAETEDPRLAGDTNAVRQAHERLQALSRLGFRGCRLPYVQPPLRPWRSAVNWLTLLVHVAEPAGTQSVPAYLIRDFLHEFYRALGQKKPESDADFRRMTEWLAGCDPVPLLPLESGYDS